MGLDYRELNHYFGSANHFGYRCSSETIVYIYRVAQTDFKITTVLI